MFYFEVLLHRLGIPRLQCRIFTCILTFAAVFLGATLCVLASTTTSTTFAITANGNAVTTVSQGTLVTLSATVVSASGTPVTTGRVVFCDFGIVGRCPSSTVSYYSAQLTSSGTASINIIPGPGLHSYIAVFNGTSTYASSTPYNPRTQTLTVTAGNATQTTLTSTSTPRTLTASVVGTGSVFAPSGSVTLIDLSNQSTALATAKVAAGPISLALTRSLGLATGANPRSIAVADFNGDGKMDLVVANPGTPSVPGAPLSVSLGKGDGTFDLPPSSSSQKIPSLVVAADFNEDGKPDLAIDDGILLGNGDGTFTHEIPYSTPIANVLSIAVGDLDQDGHVDLVIASGTSPSFSPLTILLGNGDGTFHFGPTPTTTGNSLNPFFVTVGDFNNDGILDIGCRQNSGTAQETILILSGQPGATYRETSSFVINNDYGPYTSEILAEGDFNNDGWLDILANSTVLDAQSYTDFAYTVIMGTGSGYFGNPVTTITTDHTYPSGIVSADFNSDGEWDIAFGENEQTSILLSNGDGTFTNAATNLQNPATIAAYDVLAFADFNGDGIPDLVQVESTLQNPQIYLTGQTSTATASLANISVPGSGGIHNIQAVYSGDTSFASSISNPPLQITASLVPTTLSLTSSATAAAYGQQVVLTATLTPSSFSTLNTNSDSITFLNGPTPVGTAPLSSGIATLNTTTLPAGTDSLTATFSGDTNFASSTSTNAVSVSVAAPLVPGISLSPTSLTFAAQTINTTSAAQAITLTNTGNAPLAISSIASTGSFAQTNTCGTSVSAGGTCSISVTFTPTASGPASGTLTVTDNASTGTQIVTISGSGTGISMTTPSNTLTISTPGQFIGTTVAISALSNFSGTVNIACTVAWQGTGTPNDLPTCTTNPTQASVSGSAPINATVTINTTAAAASNAHDLPWRTSGIALAALFCIGLVPRRRYHAAALFCALALVTLGGIVGCGDSGNSSPTPTNTNKDPGTSAGNYKVTVTASSSGNATASVSIPLTLQ